MVFQVQNLYMNIKENDWLKPHMGGLETRTDRSIKTKHKYLYFNGQSKKWLLLQETIHKDEEKGHKRSLQSKTKQIQTH